MANNFKEKRRRENREHLGRVQKATYFCRRINEKLMIFLAFNWKAEIVQIFTAQLNKDSPYTFKMHF